MSFELNESEMDRLYYIDKLNIAKNTKKKRKLIVLKFRSWKSRTPFYKVRPPKSYLERKKKQE